MAMAGYTESEHGSEPFQEAFLRHRKGEYDAEIDARLKRKGQKILDKYDPSKVKSSRINTHSIFWMVASIAVFYYTDFYMAVKLDPNVNWSYLYPGIGFIFISVFIGMFCVIWCHYIKGVSDYENLYPAAVPLATISFLAGMICCCAALWPIWGWLTIPILLTLFMGMMFATTILPI